MSINYDHSANRHTVEGASRALAKILGDYDIQSIIDFGCGEGMWLKSAYDLGIYDITGVDGFAVASSRLLFPKEKFILCDFNEEIDLGRKYDVALCLEVGEHLSAESAHCLVQSLSRHADLIIFSAACPEQIGQHHVNCQWPSYWQYHFNRCGYICEDSIREKIWEDDKIEWWYRQNLFVARRDPKRAGSESRIRALIHPDHFLTKISMAEQSVRSAAVAAYEEGVSSVENGSLPVFKYLRLPISGLFSK